MSRLHHRNIWLLDAAGALVSVGLLAGVLPALQPWIGMPTPVLYGLALWAAGCVMYDAAVWTWADLDAPLPLRGIMLANTGYCAATPVLIAIHWDALTPLGRVYFVAEIPVIMGLVSLEWWVYRRRFRS